MSKDRRVYSNDAMAAFLGVPVATFKDWRRRTEGTFIKVESCGNNYGLAAYSYESSLQNLKAMVAKVGRTPAWLGQEPYQVEEGGVHGQVPGSASTPRRSAMGHPRTSASFCKSFADGSRWSCSIWLSHAGVRPTFAANAPCETLWAKRSRRMWVPVVRAFTLASSIN